MKDSSYSAQSFSVISLAAACDKSRMPISSMNVSSMSRVDRPDCLDVLLRPRHQSVLALKVRPPLVQASMSFRRFANASDPR